MPTELALHGRAATMAWKHGDISEVLTPPQYIIPGICFMQATQLRTYFWYGNDPAQPSIDIGWSVANDATMGAGDSFLPNPKA